MSKLRTELHDYLVTSINEGVEDDGKFSEAVLDAAKIIEHICNFVEEHGALSLQCGSEWMFQSDEGQVGALELVGRILDDLEDYAEADEEDD